MGTFFYLKICLLIEMGTFFEFANRDTWLRKEHKYENVKPSSEFLAYVCSLKIEGNPNTLSA